MKCAACDARTGNGQSLPRFVLLPPKTLPNLYVVFPLFLESAVPLCLYR
jgi:hypothetical protein